eukprot:g6167.t1
MDAFLNGYLATVLLDETHCSDKLGDLINCCYANTVHIDTRIEYALCLGTLRTRVSEGKLDRETLALTRRISPPGQDSTIWTLHLGLRTQVFLREPELSLEEAFSALDYTDQEAGECWQNCMLVRKRYLSRILTQCGNRRTEETHQKIENAFPKDSVMNQLTRVLEKRSVVSKKELEEVQKEACQIMKQRNVPMSLLKLMRSSTDQSMSYHQHQGDFMTVEELANRVVYHGEDISIPKILPSRFQKAAEKAKRRIQELHEEKLASEKVQFAPIEDPMIIQGKPDDDRDALSAKLDTITEELKALVHLSPSGSPLTHDQHKMDIEKKRLELLQRCDQVKRELELEKDSGTRTELSPTDLVSCKTPIEKCLTGTPWKKKKKKRHSPQGSYT